MNKPISKAKVILLSWLAFAGAFCVIVSLVFIWPWLRGAKAEQVARALSGMAVGLLVTAVVVGLRTRDFVEDWLQIRGSGNQRELTKAGCLLIALPSVFIAFFCTCAPLGILAAAESSVRPVERSWTNEIWIAAWVVGVIAAISVGIAKRKQRDE